MYFVNNSMSLHVSGFDAINLEYDVNNCLPKLILTKISKLSK